MSVPAASFLTTDGPYRMISLLVLGPAGADRLIRVGETGPLLRWQFFPKVTGDLNDDGPNGVVTLLYTLEYKVK